MPGLTNKTLTGYYETEYASDWPGIVTNLPSNRIPPGACVSCNAMVVRGRLTPQPSLTTVFGQRLPVVLPTFAAGENICAFANLQPPASQQGFTVIITNKSVYIDYIVPSTSVSTKTFTNIFTFPVAYPQYARFGTTVIGNTLYFSSASILGVYALKPIFSVASVQVTNAGGYFTSAPTVVFSDGGGTGATANAFESGGFLSGIAIVSGGTNYVTPPVIALNGGSTTGPQPGQMQASAVGILSTNPAGYLVQEVSAFTGVASINVTALGSGYISPQVSFVGGGGTGATATAILEAGTIAAIMQDSPGQNYTSVPTVVVTDAGGAGAGATATAVLFKGTPFIGGDFMSSMAQRLLLGNIIGGDGNSTTGVADLILTNAGSGYDPGGFTAANYPSVDFVGGGGSGAMGYIPPTPAPFSSIPDIAIGELVFFIGSVTAGSNLFTGVNPIAGIKIGDTIQAETAIPLGTTVTAISGTTLTLSAASTATFATQSGLAYGYFPGDGGNGYYSTPDVNITAAVGTGATAIAQLSNIPQSNSSSTRYPDRIAWSAPNGFGYFDPNYLIAPGGFDTLSEARGLITSVNVVESVAFIGHNGGITEMTPNTTSALVAFSFYPLWSADEGVLVRYGSMAQYGSTLAFLSNDSAYTMTPNGLSEIGMNIANLLQNASIWQSGRFPLQGLYGSIVLIEGQKHYLIGLSSDLDSGTRETFVYDFNMAENSWHFWSYALAGMTCPIYQSFETAEFTGGGTVIFARDTWILMGFDSIISGSDTGSVMELAPLTRYLQIVAEGGTPAATSLGYQFRAESPAIARMQSERRILLEYENQTTLAAEDINPTLTFTYTGQQDPTSQTGTVSQQQTQTQVLNQLTANTIPGQVLTAQADFSTFTGVCTSLGMTATGNDALVALVRLTQVADLPKGQVP